METLGRYVGGPFKRVAKIRTFYLYEFLLVVAMLTIFLQIVALTGFPVSVGTPGHPSHDASHSLHLTHSSDAAIEVRKIDNNFSIDIDHPTVRKNESNDPSRKKDHDFDSSDVVCNNMTVDEFSVLIFGGMNVIRQWQELKLLVEEFKLVEKNKHTMEVACPYQRTVPRVLIEEGEDVSCKSTVTVTLSSNMAELNGKDVIVLGMSPYSLKIKTKVMRNKVSTDQLFVFYGVETPLRMIEWIPDGGRQPVHAVWSYLDSSETTLPYGRFKTYPQDVDVDIGALVSGKNKLVAWMGSNCVKQVFWPRMAFINELQKYINVDTYGKCGNLTCLPRMSEHCQKLMGKYKFYLAFENAECSDYITEKFWDTGLIQGAVPVVYGARKVDYERVAPPGSFIHVSDFESAESLAKYLQLLDRNDQLYKKYFYWRRKGKVEMVFPPLTPSSFCDIVKQHYLLKKGLLERNDLADTSWYKGCRHQVAQSYPSEDFSSWRPWK